ncbi:MAG: ABC transporter permease subunit [Lachnospiraceae bacterium]|nr:ABC transporter permease subunit [Lachnospiraceae bacterium]
MLHALSAVDVEQIDATRIDGTNKLQRIWYINIPVLITTIVIQLTLKISHLLGVGFEKV